MIAGQEEMLERVLVCLLSGGHVLIEGVPGLAKTLTIKTDGRGARRLVPPGAVHTGPRPVRPRRHAGLPPGQGDFETELGPVFCNFLLADEINRAPAKVQSALLEVMQERQVTIGHDTFPVPQPFLVLATQNPIESEGTYALPEAQIDRFMLKVLVDYPAHDEELTVVARSLEEAPELAQVLSLEELKELQASGDAVYVDPALISWTVTVATATRRPAEHGLGDIAEYVSFGASPRGPISLVSAARALALIRGRDYVVPATSRRSSATRSVTGSCSRTARSRRRSRPTRSSTRCSPPCRRRRSTSAARTTTAADARSPTRTPEQPGPGPLSTSSLRALELSVGRRVDGLLAGDYRSAFAGVGSELWQVRPYEPGDDVRRIEWNVTARTGEPHVRVELAERVLVTWLVLDASASMSFGTGERRKADVAEGVAIAVGYAATRRGNRLGTVSFGDAPSVERPRQGRRALLDTLRLLRELPTAGSATLGSALELADRVVRQRALVVVVSDFRGPIDWQSPLMRLAARHTVLAVEVRDPREQELADVGELRLVDPETGRQLRVDTCDRRVRERFAAAAADERQALVGLLAGAGVRHVALSTDGDWLRPLALFLRRERRGR